MNKQQLIELEKQLGCPSGVQGVALGKEMTISNLAMTQNSIELLDIKDGERVLELGYGNGGHLAALIKANPDIEYVGLEISKLMQQEACRLNQSFMTKHSLVFKHYDGIQVPYPEQSFDKVFSVNTIYFWSPAAAVINEIGRVLKPQGRTVITYAQKSFMQTLPFVGDDFNLFDDKDIRQLVANSPLQIVDIVHKSDRIKSKSGEMVDRHYTSVVLAKKDISYELR